MKVRAAAQRLFWRSYWAIYGQLCRARPYQELKRESVDYLQVRDGGKYLDLASGPGFTSQEIKLRSGSTMVFGLDSSPSAIEIARENFPEILFVEADFNKKIPFTDSIMDGVLAQNALYLARDAGATLQEIRRVLIPGGRLVMSNPIPKASVFAILARHLEVCREEFRDGGLGAFSIKLKMAWETIFSYGAAMVFLPFQIALKLSAGGASNFWDEATWRSTILSSSMSGGGGWKIVETFSSYAGQNSVFVLERK